MMDTSTNVFLPNADNALVEDKKITNYLLDFGNPQNKGKASFFTSIGYSVVNIEIFKIDLKTIAKNGVIESVVPNIEGEKYVIIDSITAPNGKNYVLKTIWLVEFLTKIPRLITAYPN